jgi:TolA-binding protein
MNIWRSILIIGAFSLVAVLPAPGFAEEKAPQNLNQYLEDLQIQLDHAAQRANRPTQEGTSVVGLRGSQAQPEGQRLYWKTTKGKTRVPLEEIKAYRDAVAKARAGNTADAITALKDFQTKYPKSGLTPDVKETIARLSAAPAK